MIVPASAGEVRRTWKFKDHEGFVHQIDLFHHTITGAHIAMLDHKDLSGSKGTSSVFQKDSTIAFRVGQTKGSVSIQRRGDVIKGPDFEYRCTVEDLASSSASRSCASPPEDTYDHDATRLWKEYGKEVW